MSITAARFSDPLDLMGAVFSSPLASLIIAVAIAGVIAVIASRPGLSGFWARAAVIESVRTRYAPEQIVLRVTAGALIIVTIAAAVLNGYVLTGATVRWWQFAVSIAGAAVGISVAFCLLVTRGTTPPESPVISAGRRGWMSFSSRPALIFAGLGALTLLATTIAAGIASSPNGEGQYVWLTIPIPNEADIDPIRLPFYGWAYGASVLVCLTVLAAVTWATLDRNAARPFLRPETVAAERDARRRTARGTVFTMTAATLLTLAAAWRIIAGAGSVSLLTIDGQNSGVPYEASWRFAELAITLGWCAPLLEIAAFTLLLVIAAAGRPGTPAPLEPTATVAAPADYSETSR